MAQSVKRQTLDLGSGHDLTVHEFEPTTTTTTTTRTTMTTTMTATTKEFQRVVVKKFNKPTKELRKVNH